MNVCVWIQPGTSAADMVATMTASRSSAENRSRNAPDCLRRPDSRPAPSAAFLESIWRSVRQANAV